MTLDFAIGDWIVHNTYGVGQIKKVEKRPIHGEKVKTFRVKIDDGSYWLPVKNADNSRVRRVMNKRSLKRALDILAATPQAMAENYRTRKARIQRVIEDGSIQKMARLLRDLLALRNKKKLNNTERSAVDKLKTRLEQEYAIIFKVPMPEARSNLEEYLNTQN